MKEEITVICSCGEKLIPVINEEFNYKDIIECGCGRKLLIVDISSK